VTVTVDSVTTGDASPTSAPHRVSLQATKSNAQIKFTPSGTMTAFEVRKSATVLEHIGNLIVPFTVKTAGATVRDFSSSAQQTVDIDASELTGGGDGDIDVTIYEHPLDGSWG